MQKIIRRDSKITHFLLSLTRDTRLLFAAFILLTMQFFSLAFAENSVVKQNSSQIAENILYLFVKDGLVKINLRPDLAPQHVTRIKKLTREGFYDDLLFHRVIKDTLAQTGDPQGTGRGSSDYPNLPPEFSNRPFKRASVGMARARALDSANSQFFILMDDAPWLNGKYTYLGEVIEGLEYIEALEYGPIKLNGRVKKPDRIHGMMMMLDYEDKLLAWEKEEEEKRKKTKKNVILDRLKGMSSSQRQ